MLLVVGLTGEFGVVAVLLLWTKYGGGAGWLLLGLTGLLGVVAVELLGTPPYGGGAGRLLVVGLTGLFGVVAVELLLGTPYAGGFTGSAPYDGGAAAIATEAKPKRAMFFIILKRSCC